MSAPREHERALFEQGAAVPDPWQIDAGVPVHYGAPTPAGLALAERIQLSLDVIEDNARILAGDDLSDEERAVYEQSSENARARLAEARLELLLAPPVEPAVEIMVEVTTDPNEPRAELPWSALLKARARLPRAA